VWHPTITSPGSLDKAETGEWHVIADHEQLLGNAHVEKALARPRRLLLVVINVDFEVWTLQ